MKLLTLYFFALNALFISSAALAIELQSAPEAEKMATLDATNSKEVYGSWLFAGGFQAAEFTGANVTYASTFDL